MNRKLLIFLSILFISTGLYSAIFFNSASSQYLTCGQTVKNLTEVTISVWVYHNDITADQYIYIEGTTTNGILFLRDDVDSTSGRTDCYTVIWGEEPGAGTARYASNTNTTPLNRWTHVCVTIKTDNVDGINMYIDGVVDSISPISMSGVTLFTAGTNARIGANATPALFFNGFIDDYRIYNRALSQKEVQQLAESRSRDVIIDESLLAWYKMDDGMENIPIAANGVFDWTKKGYNCTGSGSPTYIGSNWVNR